MLQTLEMTEDLSQSAHAADGYHLPVMPGEVVRALGAEDRNEPTLWVDGTVGGGGHAERILEAAGPEARLIGIDRDDAALEASRRRLARFGPRLFRARFDELESVFEEAGVPMGTADGALMDLGVSSRQIDDPARGFSFAAEGPLDMRMDRRSPETAAGLIDRVDHGELARILHDFGEEKNAGRIAREILRRRPFQTTRQLAEAVVAAFGGREKLGRVHVATRTFQALRIAVNRELEAIERALPVFLRALRPGGRLAVISFHSLEDRIVKRAMRDWASGCECPPKIPICVCGRVPRVRLLWRKGIKAQPAETARNPRARSATLRAIEKIEERGGVERRVGSPMEGRRADRGRIDASAPAPAGGRES